MENHLEVTYNIPLVLLSILVAIFSASVALDISSRLKYARKLSRFRWIALGSISLGLGIWSMHFIGMLAFHLKIPVTYHIGIVLLSILPAILSSGLAFFIISQKELTKQRLFIGSGFISIGIVSMHYVGMEAMQMNAVIHYQPAMWFVSVIVAFLASSIGLYLLYALPDLPRFHWRQLLSSALIGMAVSGMHYIGMAAAHFTPVETATSLIHTFSLDTTLLAFGVALSMLFLLILSFSTVRNDKQLELQSIESELKFESVIASASDAIIVTNHEGAIMQWNRGAELLFQYTKADIAGKSLFHVIAPQQHSVFQSIFNSSFDHSHPYQKRFESLGLRRDGIDFPFELSIGSWSTFENKHFYCVIIRDITERKHVEQRINQLVYLDSLTGLPNKRLFQDRLQSYLQQTTHSGPLALYFIDLDNFKMINDRFGHSTGDQFLRDVTARLQLSIGPNDTLARYDGDEFFLLVPQTTAESADIRAKVIFNQFTSPFFIGEEPIFVSVSIGISQYPIDGENAEALIDHSINAMYLAKEEGKNQFKFFNSSMNASSKRRSTLALSLFQGLQNEEFSLLYQPQLNLISGDIVGVEALLRWNHPELGSISPAEFIPIAEMTGSIHQIGKWVLHTACMQNRHWLDNGIGPFKIAINISSLQFSQTNLCDDVRHALTESQLPPELLELELTETVIQHAEKAIETMYELTDLGVRLSIDDFGTGYSSLSYLKRFPIDALKIDRSFIQNLEHDEKDAALVKTIIRMAHDLGLKVIAEGIETTGQCRFLREQLCNEGQGYLFHRPLSTEVFESYIASHQNR